MSNNTPDDVYRTTNGATAASEHTRVLQSQELREANAAAAQSEADDLASQRAAERAERDRSLGKVRPTGAEPAGPVVKHHTNDRFAGSLGLFLLRLATAGIMGVHGLQKLMNIPTTQSFLTQVGIPSPHWAAWGNGIAEVLAAVALLFGVFTRIAGLGVAAIGILALVFVKWGHTNPFQKGIGGFSGELELLLAAVGLALFFLGAGRWSIDGQFRANRRRNKLQA